MTREDLIRQHFDRTMHLLELGPSYNPVVPKADGWRTTIVDHASQADLVAKYGAMGVATIDRIEPVDHIWRDGPLAALVPQAMHGHFDGLVASHVGEHFPDLVGFFQNASRLIKPGGVMALALPDKRVCFDFFQPLTMTGDLVAAHLEGRTRHQRRTFFNQAAYLTTRDAAAGWARTGATAPFVLAHPLALAQHAYDSADESPASEYRDTHAWAFTPKSFELLVLELNLLGHIDWTIRAIEPASGVEFYVWLEQKRMVMPEAEINPLRLSLLTAMVHETRDAIAQLDAVAALAPAREPTPAAAIETAIRAHEAALTKGDAAAVAATWHELSRLGRHDDDAAPRLIEHALRHYKAALLADDKASIVAAWTEVAEMTARLPDRRRRRLRTTLSLLRNPTVSRSAFALRRVARPVMQWAFRA